MVLKSRILNFRRRNQAGFTLIELMIVVAIIGILAAIAIPNFLRFQARSRQGEAPMALKGIYTANTAFYAHRGVFSGSINDAGYENEPGNRFAYYMSDSVIKVDSVHTGHNTNPIGSDSCNKTQYLTQVHPSGATEVDQDDATHVNNDLAIGVNSYMNAMACGNVDRDTGLDVWIISSASIKVAGGCGADASGTFAAASGLNVYNDVVCDSP